MTDTEDISPRDASRLVRQLKVFQGELAFFDIEQAPEDPLLLFDQWFRDAVKNGAVEPHAMTLSTIDENGWPSSRTLILKDFDRQRLYFASSAVSRKGAELAASPRAALNFYWREFGRQIRVRGKVAPCDPQRSVADFRARSAEARAESLLGKQSQPLKSWGDWEKAIALARRRQEEDPSLVPADWTLYMVEPIEIEFWQADRNRKHARLNYAHTASTWSKQMLWP